MGPSSQLYIPKGPDIEWSQNVHRWWSQVPQVVDKNESVDQGPRNNIDPELRQMHCHLVQNGRTYHWPLRGKLNEQVHRQRHLAWLGDTQGRDRGTLLPTNQRWMVMTGAAQAQTRIYEDRGLHKQVRLPEAPRECFRRLRMRSPRTGHLSRTPSWDSPHKLRHQRLGWLFPMHPQVGRNLERLWIIRGGYTLGYNNLAGSSRFSAIGTQPGAGTPMNIGTTQQQQRTGNPQCYNCLLKSHMHLMQYVDQVCIICGSVKVTLCPLMSSIDGVCTCTIPSTHISVDLVIVL